MCTQDHLMHAFLLFRFHFGHSPPELSNFRSFKDSAKTDDAMVAIEADVNWHSEMVWQLKTMQQVLL